MTRTFLRRLGGAILTAALLLPAIPVVRADPVQVAQNQPRAAQAQAPGRLRPELLTVFDCRREIDLVTVYWDRLSGVPGVRLERRFIDAAVRAYQSGNVEECWRTINELRRHMGL